MKAGYLTATNRRMHVCCMIPLRSWLCKCAYYTHCKKVVRCHVRFVHKWRSTTFALKEHLSIVCASFLSLAKTARSNVINNMWKALISQTNYVENIPSTSEWNCVYLNVYLQNAGGELTYRTRLIHFLQWWVGSRKKTRTEISSFLASIPDSKLNRLNLLLLLIALLLICFTIFYSG